MPYKIEFTPEAIGDLERYRKFEQKRVLEEIEEQLLHQPSQETRNRKRLRPNEVAEWELRIGPFRVFYDVTESDRRVKVEAVGHKEGSRLFLHGQEFEL